MAANLNLLKELCEAFGVPGYENEVAKIMRRELSKHCKEVSIDRMGNVVARRVVNPKKPVIMLGAHMDEIGMMVKTITEKGFLRFMKIGGIDDRVLLNQHVVLNTARGKLYGVIGNKPPHLQKEEEMKKIVEVKSMFIDIGAKDKKDAEKMGVRIGDPIGFDEGFKELANGLVTGKALDNRIGCYVMLELARRVPRDVNLIFVGTVQEEVSAYGKGAMVSAYRETPHYFIALDTCIASDHPECAEDENPVKMNAGVGISLVEWGGRGNVADKGLVDWLIRIAEKKKIPYQLEVMEGGATDAAHVFNVREGIPSVAVCVPTRYIHSNVGVLSLKDVESTIELMESALKTEIE